jgi:hypothetical protein
VPGVATLSGRALLLVQIAVVLAASLLAGRALREVGAAASGWRTR